LNNWSDNMAQKYGDVARSTNEHMGLGLFFFPSGVL
jgi:hypothetical protein